MSPTLTLKVQVMTSKIHSVTAVWEATNLTDQSAESVSKMEGGLQLRHVHVSRNASPTIKVENYLIDTYHISHYVVWLVNFASFYHFAAYLIPKSVWIEIFTLYLYWFAQ